MIDEQHLKILEEEKVEEFKKKNVTCLVKHIRDS